VLVTTNRRERLPVAVVDDEAGDLHQGAGKRRERMALLVARILSPRSRIGQRGAFDRVACEQASTRGSIAAVEPTCPHVGQTTRVSMRSWLPPRHAVDKVWTALNQQLGQLGDVGGDAPGLVGRLTPRATMSGLGV